MRVEVALYGPFPHNYFRLEKLSFGWLPLHSCLIKKVYCNESRKNNRAKKKFEKRLQIR